MIVEKVNHVVTIEMNEKMTALNILTSLSHLITHLVFKQEAKLSLG